MTIPNLQSPHVRKRSVYDEDLDSQDLRRRSWPVIPCQGFQTPAWDSPNSSLRLAKWASNRPEGGYHRPIFDLHNGRLRERANSGAHETHVQAKSRGIKNGSVALDPPAGLMPILLSAN